MCYVLYLLLFMLIAARAGLHPLRHDAVEHEVPDGLRVRLGLRDGAGAEEHGGRDEVAQPPRVHLPKHVLEVGDVRGEGLVVVIVPRAIAEVAVEDVARGLEINCWTAVALKSPSSIVSPTLRSIFFRSRTPFPPAQPSKWPLM